MNLVKMAWRNVWRNTRRSVVTIGAMTIALAALLVFSGLMRGLVVGLERNIVELEIGDVQIFAPGYRDRPSIYERIALPEELLSRLEAAGFRASARLRASGLAAGGTDSSGAQFIGLDVARDRTVSRVAQKVEAGQWLDPASPDGVVIGRRLAKSLHLGVGGEILLLSTAADGGMANDIYTVRGVLGSVGEAVDRAGVYLNATAFRELMAVSEGAHQIIVRRPEGISLSAARDQIAGLAQGLDVQSWSQQFPAMAQIIQTTGGSMVFLILIVYLAVGIVVLNAMMMAVYERIREFGVLKAVGMKPRTVLALIFLEGGVQTFLALILGHAVALPLLYYLVVHGVDFGSLSSVSVQGLSYPQLWTAKVDIGTFTSPIGALLVIVTLAMTVPALKAARLDPIRAIHHR